MSVSPPDAAAAVRLVGLTKRFRGFQLGPLDFVLEAGTVVALVGPNGAGKTTTLNCMAGLVVPDEGGTEVFGAPVHPPRPAYRRDVGYLQMGLLAQEATVAHGQRRPRAAAAGWAGFAVAGLLLVVPYVALARGLLTWNHVIVEHLVVAMAAMVAAVELYARRTDFTR
jgi:hypothetical protein